VLIEPQARAVSVEESAFAPRKRGIVSGNRAIGSCVIYFQFQRVTDLIAAKV